MSPGRRPLVLGAPGDSGAARALAERLDGELATATCRHFPDGELYVRIDSQVSGREVWLVCTLHPVSEKLLPAYLLAATAKDLGASSVRLAAPYLAYLRQDARFHSGEGVTARYVGRMLSSVVDGVVTVDPHLHRLEALDEVYSVPTQVVRAAPRIAEWVRDNVERPAIIGPDAESEQWVRAVAEAVGCPWRVLRKVRRGDREVAISSVGATGSEADGGGAVDYGSHTPVLVDDIVSTARTMIEAIAELRSTGAPAPVCVGVHGVFADSAYQDLCAAGAARVITCNTITHPSNGIEVLDLVADAMRAFTA